MFIRRCAAAVALSLALATPMNSQQSHKTVPEDQFVIRTGLNVSHWLSQSDARGKEREQFMTAADFQKIGAMGFDHVRIPVDEVQLWDSTGHKEPQAFALLHKGIQWAMKSKLRAIVDLHIIRSHYFNAGANPLWTSQAEQDKLVTLWQQLSEELGKYPNAWVAYELLNEAVALDPEEWNNLVARMMTSLRSKEPERTVVIGSNMWQTPGTFPTLRIPENDKHIILSYHFYTPLALTHHEASWTPIAEYTGPVHYPGQIVDTSAYQSLSDAAVKYMREVANGNCTMETLEKEITPAITTAKAKNLPLYCGEFGVYPTIPDQPKLQWYKDLCDIMRRHNIAYCHWNYKSDFPVVNKVGSPDEKLVSILTSKK
jgi:endoglucanase